MNWLMFAAGACTGTGIGLLVGSAWRARKLLVDGQWTADFLDSVKDVATWKQVKERSGTYQPRHSPKAVQRTTSVSARMKGWWAKVEASTRPRDPKEVFRGA